MTLCSIIRKADLDAHETLSALHGMCFSDPWSVEEFRSLLAAANIYAFTAQDADGTEGNSGFILFRHAADEAEIITLGVAPSQRRKGVAGALLSGAVAALETDNIKWLFLEVAEDNAAALGFYRSHGFVEVGRRAGYYANANGGRRDAIVMRRPIRTRD